MLVFLASFLVLFVEVALIRWMPAYIRLLRQGQEVARLEGQADFEFEVKEPGAYRLEAWLKLDGEWRPWIFANPLYVR